MLCKRICATLEKTTIRRERSSKLAVCRIVGTEERARRRALVERINAYLGARPYIDETHLAKRIERMSRQLELGPADAGTIRLWATEFGRQGLAEQLAAIS